MSIRRLSPRSIPALQTDLVCSQDIGRDVDKDGTLRVDLMLGRIAGTPQFTLQQADSIGTWEDVETIEAVEALGTTCTFTAGSLVVAATAHPFTEGQLVTFSSTGQLPTGIRGAHLYRVTQVLSANSVSIVQHNVVSFANNIPENAGSGTHSIVAVSYLSSRLLPNIVADQPYLPTRRILRWCATTALGETAQVIGVTIR